MTTRNVKTLKNNQQRGKDLEQRFMKYLSSQGYWVHFMNPAPDGSQPFDIVACQGSGHEGLAMVCAFDCKTLDGDRFPLSRVEDNQRAAFELLNRKGIHNTYFIVEKEENLVYIIPSQDVEKAIKEGKKSIKVEDWSSACIGSE